MPYVNQVQAQENYCYYKNKYQNAVQEKQMLKRSIDDSKSDRINFSKRIKELGVIIQMLEGNSLFNGVPFHIDKADKLSQKTDQSFKECIKCDGVACADFHKVFRTKCVTEDTNSNSALTKFKQEKQRLETELDNLNRKINSLETQVEDLTRNINGYFVEMDNNKRLLWSY